MLVIEVMVVVRGLWEWVVVVALCCVSEEVVRPSSRPEERGEMGPKEAASLLQASHLTSPLNNSPRRPSQPSRHTSISSTHLVNLPHPQPPIAYGHFLLPQQVSHC